MNCPNLAATYWFEKSGSMHALVMEIVAGDDFSQRISAGTIPLDERYPSRRRSRRRPRMSRASSTAVTAV
jgi:phage-related protein